MRTLTAVVVALVLLAAAAVTQERRPQDLALQAAIRTETVDGNLESAIKQFGDIAEKYKSDRATVATALVHLAGCYQKRGDVQATAIYQRVVREFADQKDAVTLARARLGTGHAGKSLAMAYRRVWHGPKVDTGGSVSPDGRYLSYVDWDTGDLALHDLMSGVDRRLTSKGTWSQSDDFAEASAISRDGSQVAYAWYDHAKERYELRAISLTATGIPQPRTVFSSQDVEWLAPSDWSPDSRFVSVTFTRPDRSAEIGVIDVQKATLRPLKPVDRTSFPTKLLFDRDGASLAFDLNVGGSSSDDRDVFLVAVDGHNERRLVRNPGRDVVMGWSPDGRSLLFVSDRTGSNALWRLPFEGGPEVPELVKSDLGGVPLGISAAGHLYVGVSLGNRNIHVAEMDFSTGKLVTPPVNATERFVGVNQWPDWSPDGKYLSYVSARNAIGRNPVLAVQSLDTGQVRELRSTLTNAHMQIWAPDGRSFIAQGIDVAGRQGVHRIDAETGEATLIVASGKGGFSYGPQLSLDGKTLFYGSRMSDAVVALVARDLESGAEREVIRRQSINPASVSPDGRTLAFIARDRSTKSSAVLLLPTTGGEPRELLKATEPQALTGWVSWAPDSRQVIVNRMHGDIGDGKDTLLVPISGGSPRSLDLPDYAWGRIRVHPDGKRIAYLAGFGRSEVWVLENFLPPTTSARR